MFLFDHVALSVKNLEDSISFYQKLGFKFFKRYDDPNKRLSIVLLKLNDMILELFSYSNCNELPEHAKNCSKDLETVGTKHFALCVSDINLAAEFVVKNGISKEKPIVKEGRLKRNYFFIEDPDGIFVEIIEKD